MKTPAERFRSKVDLDGPTQTHEGTPGTPCHVWAGAINSAGYGVFWADGRPQLAHRIAWAEANGPIPPNLIVQHRCDNPACVRLDHLELGTHVSNARDAARKGRTHRMPGERNPRAKLRADAVRRIRIAARWGARTRWIAARHGVAASTVRDIAAGRTWVHLPDLAAILARTHRALRVARQALRERA